MRFFRKKKKSNIRVKARYFGVKNEIISGAVYAPENERVRFHVELIERDGGENFKVLSETLASFCDRVDDEIPFGCEFRLKLPDHWKDGIKRRVYLRVKETGKVFPDNDKFHRTKNFEGASPSIAANNAISEFKLLPAASCDKSHLVLVTHEMTRTGAPIILLNLIRYFKEVCGQLVTCVSMECGEAMSDDFKEVADVFIEPASNSEPGLNELNQVLKKYIKDARELAPTVVIVNSLCSLKLLPAFDRSGVPVFWLIHEFSHMFAQSDINRVFQNANRVIFPSDIVKKSYVGSNAEIPGLRSKGCLLTREEVDEKSVIASQGVWWKQQNEEIPRKSAELRASQRREWSIPKENFVILCVGTVDDRKGADWFVRFAIEFLSQPSERPVSFVWVGKIAENQYCRHLALDIIRSGFGDHIHLVGESTEMDKVYSASDLFLLSSRLDPFPNVVMEALLFEIPVVGFDKGQGTSEILENCGRVVPYMDLKSTAAAVLSYVEDDELQADHGRNGRQLILDRYSHEEYGEILISLIAKDLGALHPVSQHLSGEGEGISSVSADKG